MKTLEGVWRENPDLQVTDREEFSQRVAGEFQDIPVNYIEMKRVNAGLIRPEEHKNIRWTHKNLARISMLHREGSMVTSSAVAETGPLPVLVSADPLVTECPPEMLGEWLTPSRLHYVRHHFDTMHLESAEWKLQVEGMVNSPGSFALEALQALPSYTVPVTLECAGNGRSRFQPPASGNQFGLGAVSTAEWTGVPLWFVLSLCQVQPEAQYVWFQGADYGPQGQHGIQPYGRGLELDVARYADVILAYEMNGEPLTAEHGAPLRLIVPGWYGMASVKWLTHIRVTNQPYQGYFQSDRYVYVVPGRAEHAPVAQIRVKSLITRPRAGEKIDTGRVRVIGMAWAGEREVSRVEFSDDGGKNWTPAELDAPTPRYTWRSWHTTWSPPAAGTYGLLSRATDLAGETQPDHPEWNEYGYGNNAIESIEVHVTREVPPDSEER